MAEDRIRGILRETQSPYETVAFVFVDAFAGVHVGNAVILSETPFGDYEASPWTWNMFAKLTDMTRNSKNGSQQKRIWKTHPHAQCTCMKYNR